jgi:Putative DNA-binding domain
MKHLEAQRQSALLAAVLAKRSVGQVAGFDAGTIPFARGLGAYRVHARASAGRALASTFPTVHALLGEDNFQALAHSYLLADPQRQADLGEWGSKLPAFIATQAGLQAWPYLADCARLDHAVHRCERAADANFDAASLARLADTDPSLLHLDVMPGTALITSTWPLHWIHQAHAQPESDARDALFAQVREAIAAPKICAVLVAREGWRAAVSAVLANEVVWTQQLLAGASLGTALNEADAAFDFNAWLTRAVTAGQLKGISLRPD